MTKLEIIEETTAYYSEDTSRRSIENDMCLYFGPNGKRCAFSRYVEPGKEEELAKCENKLAEDISHFAKYHKEDGIFWYDLQRFHDISNNWCDKGLTETGKSKLEELREKYRNQ